MRRCVFLCLICVVGWGCTPDKTSPQGKAPAKKATQTDEKEKPSTPQKSVSIASELGTKALAEAKIKEMETQCKEEKKALVCNDLARRYIKGLGVQPDTAKAYTFSQRSCDHGDMRGCTDMAIMMERGLGTMRDPAKARVLHQNACSAGVMRGCTNMGVMLLKPDESGKSYPKQALDMFKLACKGQDKRACSNMGYLFEKGLGVEKDVKKATVLYRRSCEDGDAQGCYNLGVVLSPKGPKDTRNADIGRARQLFKDACSRGHVEACYNYGAGFYSGIGEVKDLEKARMWFEYVCSRNNAQGCLSAGMIRQQLGTKPSSKTVQIFHKGCNLNPRTGCEELGLMLIEGRALPRDTTRAALVLGRGCEVRKMKACGALAALYARGDGVEKNTDRARRLAARACKAGVTSACTLEKSLQ